MFAQAHQVIVGIVPAAVKRPDMMDFIGRCIKAALKAALTERMLGDIQVTDFTPGGAVTILVCGISVIEVVLTVHLFGVDITISLISEVRAGREGAGLLGFVRHVYISLWLFHAV